MKTLIFSTILANLVAGTGHAATYTYIRDPLTDLEAVTAIFPASGPATGIYIGHHPKSKFLGS